MGKNRGASFSQEGQVDSSMGRWLNDPAFARQLKADPKAALASCGIEPDAQLVRSVKDVDSSTAVEELQRRVSKGRTLNN